MMNFNFCNDEEDSLLNEDYCRLNIDYSNQSANVSLYNSEEISTQTKSKDKTNSISIKESEKKYFTKERKKMGKWTQEEDEILKELVLTYGGKCWKKISEHIRGRSEIQCLHRWTKILQPGLVKGPWTIEEDRKLVNWIKKFGAKKWSQCSQFIQGRSDKQCRERWFNCLNPKVKKGNWSAEEDYKIFYLYKKIGSKWALIANYFEGRSENSVKNRFYSTLRRYFTEKKKSFKKKNADEVQMLKETLAKNAIKPSACPKDELMKFFEISFYEAKEKFMNEKKFNEKDIKLFESQIERRRKSEDFDNNENMSIRNNNSVNFINDKRETKSQSSLSENQSDSMPKILLNNLNIDLCNKFNTNNQPESIKFDLNESIKSREEAHSYYKNMDIYSLEKNISEMCDDNDLIFKEPQFDNYIDNMMDGIFKNINDNMNIDTLGKYNSDDGNYENMSGSIDINQQVEMFSLDNKNSCVMLDMFDKNTVTPNYNVMGNNDFDEKNFRNPENQNDKKNERLHSLFDQLNDLEKLIKSAKRELIKYGKSAVSK